MPRVRLDLHLPELTQTPAQSVKGLNARTETIALLGRDTAVTLRDLGFSRGLPGMTPNSASRKGQAAASDVVSPCRPRLPGSWPPLLHQVMRGRGLTCRALSPTWMTGVVFVARAGSGWVCPQEALRFVPGVGLRNVQPVSGAGTGLVRVIPGCGHQEVRTSSVPKVDRTEALLLALCRRLLPAPTHGLSSALVSRG